jgi:hypothetical protein
MRALERRLAQLQSPIERAFPWHKPWADWTDQQRETCARQDVLEHLSDEQLQWLLRSANELLQTDHERPMSSATRAKTFNGR